MTCRSCGSSFNLLPNETVTCTAVQHKTLYHFELKDRIGVGDFGEVGMTHNTELNLIAQSPSSYRAKISLVPTKRRFSSVKPRAVERVTAAPSVKWPLMVT